MRKFETYKIHPNDKNYEYINVENKWTHSNIRCYGYFDVDAYSPSQIQLSWTKERHSIIVKSLNLELEKGIPHKMSKYLINLD